MKSWHTTLLSGALLAATGPVPSARAQEALERVRLGAEILARWAPRLEDGGAELRGALPKLSPERLAAVAKAESTADLRAAVFGKGGPLALGDDDSDLVYFPLTPCRLADTRNTPTGPVPIAAGTGRQFEANNNLGAQGGEPAGCGVPQTDPAALAVTITAVNPQGPGNLRAYPVGTAAPPVASAVNYALPGSGLNLANTTMVPLLQDPSNAFEFAIRADVSTVHVVVDVVGYFLSPLRAAPPCVTVSNRATIPVGFSLTFSTPTCPAGTTLTGGGADTNLASRDVRIHRSEPNASGAHWTCGARNFLATEWTLFDCSARCCQTPGR
jgi:hypothetical protein